MTSIAEILINAQSVRQQFEDALSKYIEDFSTLTFDDYDSSIEINGVPDELRLSVEGQQMVYAAGFAKIYLNHLNKWETHYNANTDANGWRVSYPQNHHDGTGAIYVEKHCPGWPQEWYDDGHVIIWPA